MALAEVFERIAGPDAPVGIPGLRREPGRGRGLAGADHGPVAGRRVLPGPGAGRARAGPGLRVRAHRRGRRHVHGAGPDGQRRSGSTSAPRAARAAAPARRAAGAAAADPAAAAGGPRPPPVADRAGGTPRAGTRARSRTTTTCPTRSTSGCSARPWPTPARATRARTPRWRRRRRTSTTWSPASSGCARGCGCSTWAAAGAAWSCTRPASTASGRSASPCPSSRRCGRSQAIKERGLSDLAEVRHLDYRDVAETGFDAVSSIGLTEHIGKAQLPGYFAFLYGKLKPRGTAAEPLHHPHRRHRARPAGRTGSSTGTCSPTGSSRRPAT